MSFIEKLKWFWDPRTDEQKEYDKWDSETPLQKRIQDLNVYFKDRDTPVTVTFIREDINFEMGNMRWASDQDMFNVALQRFFSDCALQGITIDSVWYSPETIERIEPGEHVLEDL